MTNKLENKYLYPVVLVLFLDFLFTLIGQPSEYWRSFSSVNEGSPLGFITLKVNPLLFVFFGLLYLTVMVILIKKLPLLLGEVLALSLYLGHIWGSSSWLQTLCQKLGYLSIGFSYWYLNIAYFFLIAAISIFLTQNKKCNPFL